MNNSPIWDQRYQETEWAYGTEPNDFLREVADQIPVGPVLCLAEGQGRNAVHLARRGHNVEAVDLSAEGLKRAQDLAQLRGVKLKTTQADLAEFEMGLNQWSGIVTIFGHLPSSVRKSAYRRAVEALAPGGVFILEAYSPRQLKLGTGGPNDPDFLCSLEGLKQELQGLNWEIARELNREIHEGVYHHGVSAVVQLLGRKAR